MNRCGRVILGAIIAGCLCWCLWGCKPQSQQTSQSASSSGEHVTSVADARRPSADPQQAPAEEGLIVAMGDSLTTGLGVSEAQAYPALLERKLRADGYAFKVMNAGVSGETSSGALTRTDWMLALNPDIVILETGANDGLRGVDPSVMRDNINAIVKMLRAQHVVVLLAGMRMVHNLGESYTRAFAEAYRQIAQQYDLIFMPFFLQDVGGEPSLNQRDGIHPTAAGYERIVDNLYPHVTAAIQKFRHQR